MLLPIRPISYESQAMKSFVFLLLSACLCQASEFKPLFNDELSDATYPEGVWTRDAEGVITASKDRIIWTNAEYENFVLHLEFMNGEGTNSGVFLYASDTGNWVTDSIFPRKARSASRANTAVPPFI